MPKINGVVGEELRVVFQTINEKPISKEEKLYQALSYMKKNYNIGNPELFKEVINRMENAATNKNNNSKKHGYFRRNIK